MMWPTCLTLTDEEKREISLWFKSLGPLDHEEECVVSSPLRFSVYASGLGDVKTVEVLGRILAFGYDDDGEFYLKLIDSST